MLPQHQQDTCERQDLEIELNSCFSHYQFSLNSLNSLKVTLHLGKTQLFPLQISVHERVGDHHTRWRGAVCFLHLVTRCHPHHQVLRLCGHCLSVHRPSLHHCRLLLKGTWKRSARLPCCLDLRL